MTTRRKTIDALIAAAAERALPHEHGNPSAAPITFPGGDYILPTGGSSEDVVAVRHLLMAYFLHKERPPEALRVEALRLTLALLRIGHHLSTASGMDRLGCITSSDPAKHLRRALRLSSAQLSQIIHQDVEILAALVTEDLSPEGTWTSTPVLREGNAYVVVGADSLLVALRHHLILLADQHGWRETLQTRLALAYERTTAESLRRLGWSETSLAYEHDELPFLHSIWSFDEDAGALVTVLSDDLSDYDAGNPEAPWQCERYLDDLGVHSQDLMANLFVGPSAPDRLMHLVILAGVARPSAWFDRAADDVLQAPEVSIFPGDLELVSIAERGEPLALWRFGVDAERLDTRFMVEDPLELFAVWRANDHSFYLNDDTRPTFLSSAGHAEALRRDLVQARDFHGVSGPRGRGLLEVVRRFDDLPAPIYRPLASNIEGLVVESDGLRCWVLADSVDRTLGQLVDAVAFWMWQLAKELDLDELEIQVETGQDLAATQTAPGHLLVTIHPESPSFQRSDNAGERELVRALLQALTGDAPSTLVDRVAPLGAKKMMLVFDATADAALDSRNLPPARPALRESDEAEAMDELGEHLQSELGLRVGPISSEQREPVLWTSINFHLQQMERLIAGLRPDGLLERLISLNERLLNEGAFTRYTIPTRLACYGHIADIEGDLRRKLERHATASNAVRFVIECVSARPPSGIRPVTLSVQDRLVALAAQVISRGGLLDTIREGLDDTALSVLPSGRLGVSRRGKFFLQRERYADHFAAAEVRRSHDHFPSLWVEDDEPSEQAVRDVEILDAAALCEWGASLSEVLELFGEFVALGDRMPAAVLLLDEAAAAIGQRMGWEPGKVTSVLNHFALMPRTDLMGPAPPFKASDVYPWRYGRRLAFVRRPFVIRQSHKSYELVYGFRAVDTAGRQLVNDIQTARLKVTSPQMQRAMTDLRQRSDLSFNTKIADLYRAIPGFVVVERVKKIDRLLIARPSGEPLGDIDVLVADPARQVLTAIDTKNLAVGRTPIEIAREMKRTFRSEGSKPAALDIHSERTDWLREHLDAVLAWLRLRQTDGRRWRVEASIVVDMEVPAQFLEDLPMPVLDAATLRQQLASQSSL